MESLARQGDFDAEAELEEASKQPAAIYLWGWWLELSSTRQSAGMGPSPLSRLEIRQWEEDEGHRLEPWERRAILDVDRAWLASVSSK